MTIHAEYLIDRKGERKSVLLPVKEYHRLTEYLEDLEDALDLRKAKVSAKGFIPFDDVTSRLRKQGRIR